jgi:A/G-specific adenine glycosylase
MGNRYLEPVLAWYGAQARDLPWRRQDASPWAVLVSEFMLQQTPVSRVRPAYAAWLDRWPDAPALAASPPGEAVRQWGTLGYPRRALRLHETARILTKNYGGQVPASVAELVLLPGVGAYTAAAVASFAYRQRHAVLDTNVRRVLARLERGQEFPPRSATAAETALAQSLLPGDGPQAARWSVAVMELGALVCTATRPRCPACPVAAHCAWRRSGAPAGLRAPGQPRYEGSDRQCRGRLLAVLRAAGGPVSADQLARAWPDPAQRARALDGLVADGLAEPLEDDRFALPA